MMIAAIALLPIACEKETVPNTGDDEGVLYGTWILDTKTVNTESNMAGKIDRSSDETDFTGDHFLLHLTDYYMAFGQEGTLLTFDIDDVDGTPYTYNSGMKQISFQKSITLSKGLFKIMYLSGTYDVASLTKDALVLKKVESATVNNYSTSKTTVYSFHKLVVEE